METEVHIIEKYLHVCKRWFTITNFKFERGKEIDLIAYDPKNKRYYHIESRITSTMPLRVKSTFARGVNDHKDGLEYFRKRKFEPVSETIRNITGNSDYTNVLTILKAHKGEKQAVEEASRKMGIELWYIADIINKLKQVRLKGSRDDIVRSFDLDCNYSRIDILTNTIFAGSYAIELFQ